MELGNLLSVGLSIVSIATLAGLGLLRGTVTNLREQLRDEREANASLRTQRAEDKAAIELLKSDLAALGRVVTAEAHWTAVTETLNEHHSEASRHWLREHELLTEVRDAIVWDRRDRTYE